MNIYSNVLLANPTLVVDIWDLQSSEHYTLLFQGKRTVILETLKSPYITTECLFFSNFVQRV